MLFDRKLGTAAWRVTATKAQAIAALRASDAGDPPPAGAMPAPGDGAATAVLAPPKVARASMSNGNGNGHGHGNGDSLAALLAERLGPHIHAAVSRDEVGSLVDKKIAEIKEQLSGVSKTIVIERLLADGTTSKLSIGVQHTRFEALLRICRLRLHTYLVGPMGSGKTSAAKYAADALGLEYAQKSVGLQTTEMDLLGYRDMAGKYVSTDLRRLYENGGVFLLDEIDAGNPQVLVVLNSLLANGECSFPDGMIKKHKDFILLAGANTFGLGGDRQYVGRCQLDASTLDRFVYMKWCYDASIMASMCGVSEDLIWTADDESIELQEPSDTKRQHLVESYIKKCSSVAKKLHELKGAVRHSVSPRTLQFGGMMIRAGFSIDDAMEMCCWRGLDENVRKKLL
jgi:hypothetical protein